MLGTIYIKKPKLKEMVKERLIIDTSNAEEIKAIEPLDYYGQPIFFIKEDREGIFFTGKVVNIKDINELRFYKRRGNQKWHYPNQFRKEETC